ncbi:MAG TPA: SpoIIE family protein phosphatase [Streptosporangiaceae bacterium]|jgi:serine phosphatase RsbU (regulator of sigma subunit)|nr:SpoIIE family protein phosphatase [Streptosporangiaceae bacterium]
MLQLATDGAATGEVVPVLLIEDDEADALLVREYLADAGLAVSLSWHQSLAAATPELAVGPVCVLLDLGLPDSVGFEGIRHVLSLAPDAAVLVLTGANDESLGIAAMTAGAQDYLIKGQVDGATLSRCIRYAVERKRANETARQLREAAIRQAEYTRLERGLLPVPILNDESLYHTLRYRPGRDQALLGGDFYDLIELSDGTLQALIGDVCGHGPDEAALGVCLRVAWRTLVLSGREPTQILDCLQEVLIRERHRPEVFATVATLTIDIASGEGFMHIAGHPPPVLLGAAPTTLGDGCGGPPLGLFDEEWPAVPVALGSEWSLMLYTDGLIEGKGGPDGSVLGPEGLLGLITASSPGPSVPGFEDALADTLLKTVERLNGGPMADDVAFIIVGRHP